MKIEFKCCHCKKKKRTRFKPKRMYGFHTEAVIQVKGEDGMPRSLNVHNLTLALPPKAAEDVVKRRITVGGSGPGDVALQATYELDVPLGGAGPADAVVTVLEGLVGVELSLVDIDNAGLESEASVLTVDTLDTTAPGQPGALGVTNVEEAIVEVPD